MDNMGREALMRKIQALSFAKVEAELYLDTHPADSEMLKKREQYSNELAPLVMSYEQKYGPLRINEAAANKWSWVKDPWPWDMEE